MPSQRLDKFLSSQLNRTRRDVKEDLRRGLVQVNGAAVKQPEYGIDPERDEILYGGQAVCYKEHIYIVMNKPAGVLSASNDKKRKTVVDLVPQNLKRRGLFPVGRLDRDTTGLLIITDDGDFAHRVLSPKKEVFKTYIALLDDEVTPEIIKKFEDGIVLADGTGCRRAYLKRTGEKTAEIKICEGKYHQIKRMFGTVGVGVNGLHRKSIGNYTLPENLNPGECAEVENFQLNPLFEDK